MTASIEPLPTRFHYAEYLYINDFQLLKCSVFPPNSTYANACYSGNIALLSDGSENSIGFGTPDGENYNSNYRYLNLSSMRVTNLESTDVFVSIIYGIATAHGGLYFSGSYDFQIPRGSSQLLVNGFEREGMTYVGGFSLLCRKGHNDSDASGPARVAFDDIAIVVSQTSPCGEMYTPTPTCTGCPTTAVTSCAACVPATPTATSQVLTVFL
ncbi:hypothetical protein V1517DRAFT_206684 [Lipomyces orientalis]|uniref:Uncharacterized protein n=1 Tax=Lipomyces orientalis TaxID=1233043 RepID=A0ACC3TH70_9ASCO